MYKLTLASQSPRRYAFLQNMGLKFKVINADIDESVIKSESVSDYVRRLATQKAHFVLNINKDDVVIGADTVIALGDEILGKPKDRFDAKMMIKKLSGKTHSVHTGVCVCDKDKSFTIETVTKVTFATLSDSLIDTYVATGECDDKSGSYALQGIGAMLIERVDGSVSSVVGLPVCQTRELLEKFNIYPGM